MSSKTANVVDSIDAMLSEIGVAAEKRAAEANTEPGGYQGASEHPSADVDDRTNDAQEGSRSSENAQDVKADQGSPSVESTTAGTPGGQDSVTMNIGTSAKATGEDASVETSSAKGGKDDPGTQRGSSSHPARTDNDSLDGHKYANLIAKAAQLEEIGRDLIAAIAVSADGDVQKRAQAIAEKKAADNPKPPEKAAGVVVAPTEQGTVTSDQLAKQAETVNVIGHTVQEAFDMADKTASYLSHLATADKEAAEPDPTKPEGERNSSPSGEEDDSEEEPSDQAAGNDEGGNGEPPAEAGSEPSLDLGGGGAPPDATGGLPPEMGGGPPPGMEGGAPPEMGGGPPPPEMGGGGAPGEDELLQALTGGGDIGAEGALGGMMGGPPPGMEGGAPPEMGGGPPPEMGGGPPPEMGGGPPPEMGGGMPGMEGGPPPEMGGGMPGMEGGAPGAPGAPGEPSEEDLMILMQALQAAGISPEEFEAAIMAKASQAVIQRKQQEKAAGKKEERWQPKNAAQAAKFRESLKYVHEVIVK